MDFQLHHREMIFRCKQCQAGQSELAFDFLRTSLDSLEQGRPTDPLVREWMDEHISQYPDHRPSVEVRVELVDQTYPWRVAQASN